MLLSACFRHLGGWLHLAQDGQWASALSDQQQEEGQPVDDSAAWTADRSDRGCLAAEWLEFCWFTKWATKANEQQNMVTCPYSSHSIPLAFIASVLVHFRRCCDTCRSCSSCSTRCSRWIQNCPHLPPPLCSTHQWSKCSRLL